MTLRRYGVFVIPFVALFGVLAGSVSLAGSRPVAIDSEIPPGLPSDDAGRREPGTEPLQLTIPAIQGVGRTSPYDGRAVRTVGVITGDFQDAGLGSHGDLDGFYIQDPDGDGDPNTSDGVFVFEGSSPTEDLRAGDLVELTGTVVEYFGETQLNVLVGSITVLRRDSPLPLPSPLAFPLSRTVENSDGEQVADLEHVEGMLVTVEQPLFVTELLDLHNFGEVALADTPPLSRFADDPAGTTAVSEPYGSSPSRRQLLLDDGTTVENPGVIPYVSSAMAAHSGVRTGDTVIGLVGNIRFSRGSGGAGAEAFRLEPVAIPVFLSSELRSDIPEDVGGAFQAGVMQSLDEQGSARSRD